MLRVQWNEVSYSPSVGPDGSYLYQGKPFTGMRYGLFSNGNLECEEEYRQGLAWGLRRGWYRSGALRREAALHQGGLHGVAKEWYEDGKLREQCEGEYGILLKETTWDEHGNVVKHYELKTSDANYHTLQMLRQINAGMDDKPATKRSSDWPE